MESNCIDNDWNYQKLAQEVSEKNFSMLPRNHSCDIFGMKVSVFWFCPMSLPEAEVKSYGLNLSGEEI